MKKKRPAKQAKAVARKKKPPAKKPPAKKTLARKRKPRRSSRPARLAPVSKWVKLVGKHGVVLASAHGPVPNVAEAVAGESIVGSWWAHRKGKAIFGALCELDDSEDVRCFKLIDHKVTFVHRRLWPAIVRLARDGVLTGDQVISIQQEHLPTGEHHNILTPLADWVDEVTSRAADALSGAQARAQLGAWV